MALSFPPVSQFVDRFRALLARRARFDFDQEVAGLSRVEQAVAFLALLELRRTSEIALAQAAPFAPIRVARLDAERSLEWTRPLRLITANPLDQLARTLEALLVVASAPLSVDELAEAADDDAERVEMALGLLARALRRGPLRDRARARRRRLRVPRLARGGRGLRAALRAARAARASPRRRSRRSRSSPTSARAAGRRSPGSAASPPTRPSPASLERGLIAEAGRDDGVGGAIRYRTTPLFERVFGLESLSALPRLDDIGEETEAIRARLHAVAERRGA